MTGQEAIAYFHSVSWLGSKPGLSRTMELLTRLGNPERKLRFVHVVGTNGKGSVSAFIERILREAGYRTGLYTSPFLFSFHERIRVDGVNISDEALADLVLAIRPHAQAMAQAPTEFELVTAAALLYFQQMGCQMVVLEAGLGGRLDSTNAIPPPEVVVVTRVGLDHTELLGDTAVQIAGEKAGVIKPGCEVVLYQQEAPVMDVFFRRCAAEHVPCTVAEHTRIALLEDKLEGQVFSYPPFPRLNITLLGAHQRCNAATAVEAVLALRRRGLSIPDDRIARGLSQASWPGRFEILSRTPWFILDGGHNPQCAQVCGEALRQYFPGKKVVFLLGILGDKDYRALLHILSPLALEFVTVTPDSPRALPAGELAALITEEYALPALACDTIESGVEQAKQHAGEEGLVCALGSLYMVGSVRACFLS